MNHKQNYDNIEIIAQEAAQWMIDLEEMENNDKLNREFTRWLKSSPVHIQEFLYLNHVFYEIKNNQEMETIEDIISFYQDKNNIITYPL